VRWPSAILALLALAVGFGLGRATAPDKYADLSTAASLRWALEEEDWLTRTWRLSSYLQHLGPEDVPATLEVIGPYIPWLLTDEIRLLMFAWVRFDAPGALAQALSWPPRYRRNAAGAAIYAWGFRDPEAALGALEEIDDPELVEFMRGRLIAGWLHGALKQSASDYIASLPADARRLAYTGQMASELAREGPAAVVSWAEGVPAADAGYKAEAFLQAAAVLAALDPAATARWLKPHLGRDYGRGALRAVIRSWAAVDPQASLVWVAGLPADELRKNAVYEAFTTWTDQAPGDAERWLRAATPDGVFDPAVRALVGMKQREAPAAALEWAGRMQDPELQRGLVVQVARDWVRQDPAAAGRWLAGSGLPESVRAAILARPDVPGT
jgi:hypothetical protein